MKLTQAVKLAKLATERGGMFDKIGLVSDGSLVHVRASNPRMAIAATAPYSGEINAAVNGDKLAAAISKFGDDAELIGGENVTIKAGRSRVTIESTSADDMFYMPTNGESAAAPDCIISMIQRVAFSAADGDVRHYLNGVYICAENDEAVAVATDGHRMAWLSTESDSEFAAIIPRESITALTAVGGSVSVGRAVMANTDDCTIAIQPIDGKYPDWRRVIPKHAHTAEVSRADMLDALGKVSIVANEKTLAAKMAIRRGDITITVDHVGANNAEAVISASASADMDIGINVRYLAEAVQTMGDTVTIGYTDAGSALSMTDGDLRCIIMPVRI